MKREIVALAGWVACGPLLAAAGCSGAGASSASDAAVGGADFGVCTGADAGPYVPATVTSSKSGNWLATLASVKTESSDGPAVDAPAIGFSTFTITLAGAHGGVPTGVTMTAEKPYMPLHGHSAATAPAVADQGAGTFVISNIDFFMLGYFQITLELRIAGDGGATVADSIVLGICVPF
jgi:hypothetical protein